jgi:drug/metabolite transporter (DMT)-like permease
VGYIGMAFLARFVLHEQISPLRWAGIVLIAMGVGFVARGPSLTVEPTADLPVSTRRRREA